MTALQSGLAGPDQWNVNLNSMEDKMSKAQATIRAHELQTYGKPALVTLAGGR
jgi:hypothetical protein